MLKCPFTSSAIGNITNYFGAPLQFVIYPTVIDTYWTITEGTIRDARNLTLQCSLIHMWRGV